MPIPKKDKILENKLSKAELSLEAGAGLAATGATAGATGALADCATGAGTFATGGYDAAAAGAWAVGATPWVSYTVIITGAGAATTSDTSTEVTITNPLIFLIFIL